MILCLTGGLASGKSTAAKHLASKGAYVIDADVLGQRAYDPGTEAHAAVIAEFGEIRDGPIFATFPFIMSGLRAKWPVADIAEFGGSVGTGLTFTTVDGRWDLNADYDADIKADYLGHTGRLEARYNF